jgi:tetratricopeptide (TPR) repeat protein
MRIFIALVLSLINTFLFGQDPITNHSVEERYAVVVGVSQYKNRRYDLNYSDKDAIDFQEVLIKFGNFKKENTKLLLNSDATRENIRKIFEGWLKAKLKQNDLLVVFFSGHGAQLPDTDGDENDGIDECLVPYDFDASDFSSVIVDDTFAYWIKNLQSSKILIIFDNCFSGGAAKQKGVTLPGVKGALGKDDFMNDFSREIPKSGTEIIAACKADQVSFESEELKNGIFTHFLINSISASSDSDQNKIIDPKELFNVVRQQTMAYSKSYFKKVQEPIFLDKDSGNIDLFYLKRTEKEEVNANNKDVEALLYRVSREYDPRKKLEFYKKIYDIDPYNIDYNVNLAIYYQANGELKKALEHFKFVLGHSDIGNRYNPPLGEYVGDIYNKLGDNDLALSYYLQASKEDPKSPYIHNKIGNIFLSRKDTLSAMQRYMLSIDLVPYQINPYLGLFNIYLQKSDYDKAYQIISRSYKVNASDNETRYWYLNMLKYVYKDRSSDSLLNLFEIESGIREALKTSNMKNWGQLDLDGKSLSPEEVRLYMIKLNIDKFPFYPSFYKLYIQVVMDNKMSENISNYISKYIKYSKLNPDTLFIAKYLREKASY